MNGGNNVKKRILRSIMIAILFIPLLSLQTHAQTPVKPIAVNSTIPKGIGTSSDPAKAAMIENIRKGVVEVIGFKITPKKNAKGQTLSTTRKSFTRATGFMVANGYILTNEHIAKIQSAADKKSGITYEYEIRFYNQKTKSEKAIATLIKADRQRDISLLKYNSSYTPVAYKNKDFNISTSQTAGEYIKIVGHPQVPQPGNKTFTFSWRYIEGKLIEVDHVIKRTVKNGWAEDLIAHVSSYKAQVYAGSSGSPIINAKGYVIGMVSSGGSKENSMSAIRAKDLADFLKENDLAQHVFAN